MLGCPSMLRFNVALALISLIQLSFLPSETQCFSPFPTLDADFSAPHFHSTNCSLFYVAKFRLSSISTKLCSPESLLTNRYKHQPSGISSIKRSLSELSHSVSVYLVLLTKPSTSQQAMSASRRTKKELEAGMLHLIPCHAMWLSINKHLQRTISFERNSRNKPICSTRTPKKWRPCVKITAN